MFLIVAATTSYDSIEREGIYSCFINMENIYLQKKGVEMKNIHLSAVGKTKTAWPPSLQKVVFKFSTLPDSEDDDNLSF